LRFTQLKLAGAYLIDLEPHADDRGYFARTFCTREFLHHGLDANIAQCSTSFNLRRGTLRGMHYQTPPHEEIKIVRCTSGSIFDVIVDVRPESVTRGSWHGVELSSDNHRMLYIPAGFAHGFQTLVDNSEVFYQISAEYVPSASRGIRWNDPAVAISWPINEGITISARDSAYPGIQE
jgi:dTDP-4-dehydrorhamnose 3,5-epimerase